MCRRRSAMTGRCAPRAMRAPSSSFSLNDTSGRRDRPNGTRRHDVGTADGSVIWNVGMTRYIVQRLLLLPFLLLVYSFVIFAIIHAPPGDFVTVYVALLA